MLEIATPIINLNIKRKSRFWTIHSYFVLICLIVLCQSMITSGYIGSIVSSIETYYGFSTERLGIAFSSYDIIGVLTIPLVSYFASKTNRPRIIAFGAFLFSIGNILFILPYFLNGYQNDLTNNSSNETINYFCSINSSNHSCSSSSSSLSNSILTHLLPNSFEQNNIGINQPKWTYYIVILSMIIMSIGASPFYTLGITFLTDHLNKDDQAIYTSILYGMVALGPALGFVMGSALLSQWINIGDDQSPDKISKIDPRWIGRWWAGFLVSSSFLTILSLILSTFPSHLPRNDNQIVESIDSSQFIDSECDLDQSHRLINSNEQRSLLSKMKDILSSIIDLVMNSTYILIVLINSVETILVVSFTTFMVKYIESVFNLSSSLSSILTGSIVVPAAVFGTITGGYLIRRYHLNIFGCVKLILISCLLSWFALISLLFIKCPIKVEYQDNTQCSQLCHCSQNIYQPVCYQQHITYLSPCYAGCTSLNGTEYSNCSCLPIGDKVVEGSCENNCYLKTILFLLILFFVTYFETLMATPHLMIVLRSVQHELQSFGLGLENCIMKVVAQIPSPILFGIIIDNQCLFWSSSSCHHRGSCFIYDGDRLPFTLFGTAILIKAISFILILILFFITLKRHQIANNSLLSEDQQDPFIDSFS